MPLPSSSLKPLLASIAAWIMTLDVGSNEINSAIAKDSLNTSIFINGNLARVLLASHRITGDGALMNGTSGEIQRSPRAISLLQLWDQMSASADPRVADAVSRYFAWLETPEGAAAATLRTTALATGFIGLAAADLIDEWSTFVR